MLCSKCGKEIKENSKFCRSCGNPVGIVAKEEIPIQNISVEVKEKSYKSPKSSPIQRGDKKTNKLIFIVPAVLLFIIAFIVIMQPSNMDKGNEALKNDKYQEAIDNFERVRSDDKDYQEAQDNIKIARTMLRYAAERKYIAKGKEALANKDYEEAIDNFGKVESDNVAYQEVQNQIKQAREMLIHSILGNHESLKDIIGVQIKKIKIIKTGEPVLEKDIGKAMANAMVGNLLYGALQENPYDVVRPVMLSVTYSCDHTPDFVSNLDFETTQKKNKWDEWETATSALRAFLQKKCG